MPAFTWVPDFGAAEKIKPKVLAAQFGDGYSQRSPDGINNMPRVWSVQFTLLDATTIDAIHDFLVTQAGVTAFTWTPPKGAAGKWICQDFDRNLATYGDVRGSYTFTEVFEF
jgi:phage-related protein